MCDLCLSEKHTRTNDHARDKNIVNKRSKNEAIHAHLNTFIDTTGKGETCVTTYLFVILEIHQILHRRSTDLRSHLLMKRLRRNTLFKLKTLSVLIFIDLIMITQVFHLSNLKGKYPKCVD